MENKKIAAFFDIDGTIFRDSLMVAHFMKLQDFQIIDDSKWHTQVHLSREAYKKRRLDYDTYLESISSAYEESLKGISYSDVMFAARHVIQNRADEVYKFTRSRIEQHRKKGHMVIFISGSPDFLVRQMAKVWKADVYRGSTYVFSRGIFTGKIIPMWDSVSKQNAINELVNIYDIDMKHSYAYGDTNGDISMMMSVGHPYAINPAKELIENIRNDEMLRKKVQIIVERKDVIYKVDPDVNITEETLLPPIAPRSAGQPCSSGAFLRP